VCELLAPVHGNAAPQCGGERKKLAWRRRLWHETQAVEGRERYRWRLASRQ
jgi:hypothetical protein